MFPFASQSSQEAPVDFLSEALLKIPPAPSSSATATASAESVDTSQGLHSVDSSVHPIPDTEAPQTDVLQENVLAEEYEFEDALVVLPDQHHGDIVPDACVEQHNVFNEGTTMCDLQEPSNDQLETSYGEEEEALCEPAGGVTNNGSETATEQLVETLHLEW
ncbi:hypothetical protein V6N11_067298 [Hibiscus sabdariffa]|uniref:Uncharacterized protein n=1 Tax=Hibiscus sabdariffa TaxID=183260 RepID=A0ABR2SQB4_9ROSI